MTDGATRDERHAMRNAPASAKWWGVVGVVARQVEVRGDGADAVRGHVGDVDRVWTK